MKKLLKQIYGKKNKKQMKKMLREIKKDYKFSILMSQILVVHSVTAVLGMPQAKGKRIELANAMVAACTDNEYVAIDIALLNEISTDILTYKNLKGGGQKDAWRIVRNGLNMLMAKFQKAANDDMFKCKAIIHSGKFKVKDASIVQKRKFKAKNSGLVGEINLTAQGGKQNTCHDWSMSLNGEDFVRLPPTIAGKTKVKNLTPGTYAWFTHELVTAKGGQGISQMIRIMVA